MYVASGYTLCHSLISLLNIKLCNISTKVINRVCIEYLVQENMLQHDDSTPKQLVACKNI